MEAALGTGQMSHIAAPGDWLRAVAVHLIKPAVQSVSLIPLVNDCVLCGCECKVCAWKPLYMLFQHVLLLFYLCGSVISLQITHNYYPQKPLCFNYLMFS